MYPIGHSENLFVIILCIPFPLWLWKTFLPLMFIIARRNSDYYFKRMNEYKIKARIGYSFGCVFSQWKREMCSSSCCMSLTCGRVAFPDRQKCRRNRNWARQTRTSDISLFSLFPLNLKWIWKQFLYWNVYLLLLSGFYNIPPYQAWQNNRTLISLQLVLIVRYHQGFWEFIQPPSMPISIPTVAKLVCWLFVFLHWFLHDGSHQSSPNCSVTGFRGESPSTSGLLGEGTLPSVG